MELYVACVLQERRDHVVQQTPGTHASIYAFYRPAVMVATASKVCWDVSGFPSLYALRTLGTAEYSSADGSAGIGRVAELEWHCCMMLKKQLRGNGFSGICRDVIPLPLETGRKMHTSRQMLASI